jgi:hypothetical protein
MKASKSNVNLGILRSSTKLIVLLLLILSTSGCNCVFLEGFGLAEEIREGISLEEAQELVPFTICLPTYLPSGIEATPHITYHADLGDPVESDVRLKYFVEGSQEPTLEIYQQHSPRASTPETLDDSVSGFFVRELVAWQVSWEAGWEEVDEISKQASVEITEHQNNDTRYWVYEILTPSSLSANLIAWGYDPVDYALYTRLPLEDAKKVAVSIPSCGEK